jgi:glucosamine kinase
MPSPLFIGIDGGATRCRARIGDAEGRALGDATHKASANIASRRPEAVMAVILGAVKAAARKAGLAQQEWRAAYAGLGLAGAEVRSARESLLRLFREQGYFRKADIRTDAYVTWLGAHRGEDGAILILGTGSCGLAVVHGTESFVSGYGPNISDEASGQWLGRMAVRRALWAFDGRIERTPLADTILDRFHGSPEEIITFANSPKATPAAFGELAPLVFSYAEQRDALALALVADAAADAERMITRLLDLGASSVYLHGGISERLSEWLRPAIRKRLKKPMNVEGIPLEGAILLARRATSRGGAKAGR